MNTGFLPITWCNLKTYYEHRGQYPDQYHWVEPDPLLYDDVDQLWANIEKDPPAVFGFGGYIWNIEICYHVARRVRERWPDCLIVAGGPQPEYKTPGWWKDHDYIDIVVPYDGEVPFTAILDEFAEGRRSFNLVPDILLPDGKERASFRPSMRSVPLKDFSWPASPMLAQKDYLERQIQRIKQKGIDIHLAWETTRGCPYQCTFCDWGGGTYTKVRLKPMDMVESEIDWMLDQEIESINLTDANTGMFPRDVEIMKYLADRARDRAYPKSMYMSAAKQNKDRVNEIYKMLHAAGVVDSAQVAVQDLDSDVLKHIKRVDVPWEKNLEYARELESAGIPVSIHTIMGLPGFTREVFCNNIDEICTSGLVYPKSFPFLLLPNAPAASPEYIQEHDIKTIARYMENYPAMISPDMAGENLNLGRAKVSKQKFWSRTDYVISTKWYSQDELIDMRYINSVVFFGETVGASKLVSDWLLKNHGIKHSKFYHAVADELRSNRLSQHFFDHFYHWINDRDTYYEIKSPMYQSFPFLLSPEIYWAWHLLLDVAIFYDAILKLYPECKEILRFNRFLLLDYSYDFEQGRQERFDRNWFTGDITPTTVIASDTTFRYGASKNTEFPLDWHHSDTEDQRRLQFFYRVCFGIKKNRLLKDISVV